MKKNVLLLSLGGAGVISDAKRLSTDADVELFGGSSLEDARAAFARTKIDHVIVGAGIDLETRLEIVREIFQLSTETTVHLKDRISGKEGFLPFIEAVLDGLRNYEATAAATDSAPGP